MGNTQSQNPSSKIAGKSPADSSLRDRPKDSGYRSKGARTTDQDQTRTTTLRPETTPTTAKRHSDAPAPQTKVSSKGPSETSSSPATVPCPYRTVKTLGSGTYAIVKEAVHIKTGKYYACKVINKKLMEGREFMGVISNTDIGPE